jgi:hypothetical protein
MMPSRFVPFEVYKQTRKCVVKEPVENPGVSLGGAACVVPESGKKERDRANGSFIFIFRGVQYYRSTTVLLLVGGDDEWN